MSRRVDRRQLALGMAVPISSEVTAFAIENEPRTGPR